MSHWTILSPPPSPWVQLQLRAIIKQLHILIPKNKYISHHLLVYMSLYDENMCTIIQTYPTYPVQNGISFLGTLRNSNRAMANLPYWLPHWITDDIPLSKPLGMSHHTTARSIPNDKLQLGMVKNQGCTSPFYTLQTHQDIFFTWEYPPGHPYDWTMIRLC